MSLTASGFLTPFSSIALAGLGLEEETMLPLEDQQYRHVECSGLHNRNAQPQAAQGGSSLETQEYP